MLSVQLVQPEKSHGYVSNSRTGCYAPLGLISIATYVQQQFPGTDIEILDGELMTNHEIIGHLKPGSFVGIDTKTPNYVSTLEIAEAAKERDCRVIVGGVYASALPHDISRCRTDTVDHIVVGFGEIPFADIIRGRRDRIIYNPTPVFDEMPYPDRSHIDLERYIKNFRQNHPSWNFRGTNIFTHIGCRYNCLFCSRSGPQRTYYRNPNFIWQEVRALVEKYSIRYIVDFSDSITQNIDALRRFVDTKPKDINPVFHIFSNADAINEEIIGLFRRLNVRHVFVGVETGDYGLAKTVSKGIDFSPKRTLEAIALLSKAGIELTPSFVLGLPGENKESLETTYQFAKRIKELSDFEEIFCSALIPFPESRAFDLLMKLTGKPDTDIFDPEELKKEWIRQFCHVDYATINSYVNRILDLGIYTITIRKDDS